MGARFLRQVAVACEARVTVSEIAGKKFALGGSFSPRVLAEGQALLYD